MHVHVCFYLEFKDYTQCHDIITIHLYTTIIMQQYVQNQRQSKNYTHDIPSRVVALILLIFVHRAKKFKKITPQLH